VAHLAASLPQLFIPGTTTRASNPRGCVGYVNLGRLFHRRKASSRIREAKIGTPKVVGDKATVLLLEPDETSTELVLIKTPTGWKVALPPTTNPTFSLLGESAGVTVAPPPTLSGQKLAQFRLGSRVVAQSGCLACHRIGEAGDAGPGADLTLIGSQRTPAAIERAILNPTAPMPSFRELPKQRLNAMVAFLSQLR
jgi:hypothetical protein